MDDSEDNPNYWLERAKDAYQIAKQLKDERMRNIMEEIGKAYERIANHVAHDRSLSGAGK